MSGFIDLQKYLSVDEVEEVFTSEIVDDDMFLTVREILSWREFSIGVTESSIIVVDKITNTYVQRERLVDLADWEKQFPIIGIIIDELTNRVDDYELLLSVLIDNTIARSFFESGKTYNSIEEFVNDIPLRNILYKCECCRDCGDEYNIVLNVPSYLIKAVKLAKLDYKPSMCEDGRIGIRVIYPSKKEVCYTMQKQIPSYPFY